jgi:hypothetical protein
LECWGEEGRRYRGLRDGALGQHKRGGGPGAATPGTALKEVLRRLHLLLLMMMRRQLVGGEEEPRLMKRRGGAGRQRRRGESTDLRGKVCRRRRRTWTRRCRLSWAGQALGASFSAEPAGLARLALIVATVQTVTFNDSGNDT